MTSPLLAPENVQWSFQALGLSLGLGLLVGLQREYVDTPVAGVRTFPLITLLGTLTGMLAMSLGPWVVVAGIIGVVAANVVGNVFQMRSDDASPGITTEIAILLMFAVGVFIAHGPWIIAVALSGVVAVLLHAKGVLHRWTDKLADKDVRAIMQFVLISFVIFPVLPNEFYGPEGLRVLNPRQVWMMVVLVVGISLGGFIAYKFLGKRASTILGGLFGGMISSTATTVSYAKHIPKEARSNGAINAATLAIIVASTMMYARVLVEIAIVDREFFKVAAAPIGAMLGLMAVLSLCLWLVVRRTEDDLPERENPSELRSAIFFGLLYAIVLIATAWGTQQFGDAGVFTVAGVSGLTNMHAVTLSTARLVKSHEGAIGADTAWRAIMLASLTGLVFKCGIAYVLGGRRLFAIVTAFFGVVIAMGAAILIFWPAIG